jgi:hypothetical protein
MTRARVIGLAAWLLAGAGCATVGVSPAAGPPAAAPRPTYAVGDQWVRTDGVWELAHILEHGYLFQGPGRDAIILGRDLTPWSVERRGSAVLSRARPFEFYPAPRLDWPLQVGRRGSSKGSWAFWYDETVSLPNPRAPGHYYQRTYTYKKQAEATFAWTVEGYERVKVPAGTFEAYRLYFALAPDDPKERDAPTWWLRIWYAPAIRQFVAGEGKNADGFDFQLAAADPGLSRPIQVIVRDPADGLTVSRRETVLTGRVTAGKGLARVVVAVNGAEVLRREEPGAPTETTLEVPLRLQDGRNVVLVTVTDVAGETRQEARTVIYDAAAARGAAEAARAEARAAREVAARAEAARRAADLWREATAAEQVAEAALAGGETGPGEAAFRRAREAYGRAAALAAAGARNERAAADAREAAARVADARQAAERADAVRWAAAARGQAADLQQRADGALAGQDLERAVALLREAEAAWREAERGALQQASVAAAAAERERQAALERLRQAAERQAATTGTARGAAERIAAERLATSIFAGARRAEDEGRAALARREWSLAQERLHAAEAAYREAAQAARREAERLAALERERREAERALEEAARQRAVAVAAGAEGSAAARRGAAWVRDGEAALAAGKPAPAAALFRDAQEAYRQAAAEARALAAEPVRITISAPADQAQVEQETLTVSGRIAGSRGVRGVLVTVNGKEVARRDEPAPAPSVPLDVAVRLREGQNTVVVTVTDAEGKLSQEVRSVHFERPTPLSVAVRYPAEGATLPHPSSVLAAAVTSGRGVERVTVKLNGRDVHEQVERRPPRSLAVAVPLTLEPGANAIVFTVTEAGGATRSETRTVTFKPPAGAGEASAGSPAPGAAPPERWAVVVGVGRYDNPQIARLRFAVEDAEAVARTLREVAGFKPENVVLLTDRTDRKPTLRNLKWALGTFLARSAGKGDTVVIFFAGHGAPEVDVSGKERDGLAKYLVPVDAEPDDLYATGLPMEEFETIFNRIEAERVVVFLDACYSGSAGGRTFSSRRTRALGVDDAFLERLARAKGRAIVTASRAAEVAVELSEIGHGLFTYYLVDGLRGGADVDRDGIVTLQEVYQHLEQQVTRHSRQVGASQHPVMKGELEGLLPLVRLRR